MGYFSNSSEAEIYENTHCRKCVHYYRGDGIDPCAIRAAHFFHQEQGAARDVLDILIPRELGQNGQCALFYEVSHEHTDET